MQVMFALPVSGVSRKEDVISRPVVLQAQDLEAARMEVKTLAAYEQYSFFQILADDGLVLVNDVPDHICPD